MPVDLGSINWAVLVAAAASYAIGAVWYAPPMGSMMGTWR